MDVLSYLGLRATHNPYRWVLPVTRDVANNRGSLYGGAGLAAALAAMEAATGRSTIWATAQYLAQAPAGSVLDVDVTVARVGRSVTQARVRAHLGDTEVLTVNAALAENATGADRVFAELPSVPPPEACPPRGWPDHEDGSIDGRLDLRVARGRVYSALDGTPGGGRSALWARMPDIEPSAAALAIVGDWVPFGLSQALGRRAQGTSLDNTLRVAALAASPWVLVDVTVYDIHDDIGHGHVQLWTQDGTYLGSVSQSAKIRAAPDLPA